MKSFSSFKAFALAAVIASAGTMAHAADAYDPLAGDTWHAIGNTWPGTMKFDGPTKSVILEPLGAEALQAKYEIKITSDNKAKPPAIRVLEGDLTMKSLDGRTSEAVIQIRGKEMDIKYKNGLQADKYQRMTAEEQQKAMEDLRKRIESGQVKMPKFAN